MKKDVGLLEKGEGWGWRKKIHERGKKIYILASGTASMNNR